MHQPYIIGIDVGTGSVKAVAVDFAFAVIADAKKAYSAGAEGTEQDADEVWQTFALCLTDLVDELERPPAAVVMSAAMHSVLPVNAKGDPLRKALLWSDRRSGAIANGLRGTPEGRRIYAATGTPLHASSPLCKIRWMQEAEPALVSQTAKFVSLKEYIWYRMFGEWKVDFALASATGLWNVHTLQWEGEALQFASLSHDQLSQVAPPSYRQHTSDNDVAKALRLPPDIPVFIGASDGCFANLGSLCLNETTAALTIGTSAAVRITKQEPIVDEERMVFNYRLDEESFVCGGATNNGGNVLQWLADAFFVEDGIDGMIAAAERVPAGSDGLLFLPYLHGERAPVWEEQACGVFFGARAGHDKNFFARAGIEGLCFGLNEILKTIESASAPVQCLRVSGGAAQSGLLLQLLADVTGKRVQVLSETDSAALGAAYFGLKALHVIDDYGQLPSEPVRTVEPKAENMGVYEKQFALYRQLYPSLKNMMTLSHKTNKP